MPSEVTIFSRVCEDYPPWETAEYNLPYEVGRRFVVINTTPNPEGLQEGEAYPALF